MNQKDKIWNEGYDTCASIISNGLVQLYLSGGKDHGIKNRPDSPYKNDTSDISPVVDNVDSIIDKWAKRIESVYDSNTAGDYTFHGILGEFLREVTGQQTWVDWKD